MPTYDYKCPNCEKMIEVLHRMSDGQPVYVYCPDCYKRMVKQFSAGIGVHFKGSGFYETDYKGK